jgi:hypothetical protein
MPGDRANVRRLSELRPPGVARDEWRVQGGKGCFSYSRIDLADGHRPGVGLTRATIRNGSATSLPAKNLIQEAFQ